MKNKLLLTTLILTILLSIVGIFESPIYADDTDEYGYTYSCGSQFEVDKITDDGKFESRGCYVSLSDAKAKMKEKDYYVVRYSGSRSPMKIVAMNSGLVYAYPSRSNKSTLHVYETEAETGITSYTNQFREMVYKDTTFVNTGSYKGYGILKVNLNGFDGYTDLEDVDLIPFKFIENGLKVYTGINSNTAEKYIMNQNYYVARKNGNYTDLFFNYSIAVKFPGADDSTQSGEMSIGVAPSFMKLGTYYYSPDGINFYSDRRMTNFVGTNYNYFQFLSIRSKANLTADQINKYLESKSMTGSAFYGDNAQAFIDAQNKYGMNALLIFALACNESSYGTNLINKNNIFGLGAFDANPGENAYSYDSIAECINDLEGWHLARYCDYYTDSGFYTAPYFGNKGVGISLKYASDPYECFKVSSIAYAVDKYISGNNGSLTNYNAYNLALVNKKGVDFKASANSSSATLYKSQAGKNSSYQKDLVVTVIGQEANFAKVVSGNPIDSNRNVVKTTKDNGLTKYDYDKSYAFVSIDALTPLNNNKMFNNFGAYTSSITNVSWNNNLLHIEGNARTENLNDTGNTNLIFVSNKNTSFNVKASQSNDNIVINKDIDIKDLAVGTYDLVLSTEYPNYSSYNKSNKVEYATLPSLKVINNKIYSFRSDGKNLTLRITNAPSKAESLLALQDIKLQKNKTNNHVELYIKGIGVIKGYDSLIDNETTHQLVLVDLNNAENSITVDLNNIDSFYSINDGQMYKKAGFEGTIDIDDLTAYPIGSYAIAIKTTNGGVSSSGYINTNNDDYANLSIKNNDNTVMYHVIVNDMDVNRIQIDIENIFDEIDYSTIKKADTRTSLAGVTSISFDKDEDSNDILKIDAAVMMYYLNYDVAENVNYKVYLVDDENKNIISMNTNKIANKYDYQKNYNSSFNMDNISFEATCPVNDIAEGNYKIVVEITNKQDKVIYKDLVDIIDSFGIDRDSLELDTLNYSFYVSNVRYRQMLKAVSK